MAQKDYAQLKKDAQNTAIKAHIAGKDIRALLKNPVVTFTAETEKEKEHVYRYRLNVLSHVTDSNTKKVVNDACKLIAQQIAHVSVELRANSDSPKLHRKELLRHLNTVTNALGLKDVSFGNRDAAVLVEWATRAKANGDCTDTVISTNAWSVVQKLLTNKLNAYDAKMLIGKDAYSIEKVIADTLAKAA